MIVIDKLCYTSKLRYVNAGEKFAFSMLSILFCISSRSILIAVIVLFTNGILTIKKGGISFSRYQKLLLIPLAFLLMSTLAIILNISKVPLDAFALPIGTWFLTGSWDSIFFGIQLIMTALASVSCLFFLSLNTPMTDILNILHALHCPRLLMELMLLIYRSIFVLIEIASAATTSQLSRLGNRNYATSVRSFGTLCSMLFIRAIKQSGELYDAMESRCYDGTLRVLNEYHPPRKKELIFLILFELCLLIITITISGGLFV